MVKYVESVGIHRKPRMIEMLFFKKNIWEHCNKKFSKKEELMHHLQIIHFKDLPYDCKMCNENFTNMEDMRTHLQRYHSFKKDRD